MGDSTKKEKVEAQPTRLDILKKERDDIRLEITENIELVNETEDLSVSNKALKVIDEKIKAFNAKSKEIYIEDAVTSGSSIQIMNKVILEPRYTTLKLDKDKEIGTYSVGEAQKFIDIAEVHGAAKGGIGVSKDWVYKALKLNYVMAVRTSEEIKKDPDAAKKVMESYEMKDAVRAVLFPAGIDPLKDADHKPKENIISNKNVVAALKIVIEAMIGKEFADKIISYQASYLTKSYTTHDKKALGGGIKTANDKQFVRILADICYNVMKNEEFAVSIPNCKSK